MATYTPPAKGTVGGDKYGKHIYFGEGMPARAKGQKGSAQKPGAGLWGLGLDADDPDLETKVEAWLAKHQRADGTYVDEKGRPINWMNGTDGGKWGKQDLPSFVKLKEMYPNEKASTLLDAAFRGAMSESAIPPSDFFSEYILDPLVEGVLTVGGNLITPGLGTIASTAYGGIKGGVEGGPLGLLTGGLGGYAVGSAVSNVQSGINAAGGVGNYLSNVGTSAYNALSHPLSTLGNIGKDIVNTYKYGPELTNVNAVISKTAPWVGQGVIAGMPGALAKTADSLSNFLPGASDRLSTAAGGMGPLASGGGMDWLDIAKFAVDVGVPIYTANKTQEALKEGAAAQTTATKDALALQREMFNEAVRLQQPWQQAGTNALAEQQRLLGLGAAGRGTPGYGSLAKPFSMTEFEADPGYAFRLREGQKMLERSAAARGGLLSGGTGAALTRYGQEMGSQEYQNAFNRYQTERAARLNPLQSLSGQGLTTAGTLGTAGQNYANTAGQLTTDLATINAARGIYGTAAQNQMLNQIMGRVSTYV